jgi:hypothetical protein
MKTDTSEKGLETLIMRHMTADYGQGAIRRASKMPGILFEWLAASRHKSLMKSWFLFEWKTSA